MSSSQYGHKLNPYRRLCESLGVKGIHQSVITNNPSTMDANQQLLVRFPNLGACDVIVPGTVCLAFTISLTSTYINRTVDQNLGRAVVKKTTIKISGNNVMSIDDSDMYGCYNNLWKTAQERENAQYQGIDTSDNQSVTKNRVGAGDKDTITNAGVDKAISDAYSNQFYIPLDFELLESHMPFYECALGDRLQYELTFNDYNRVIMCAEGTATTIDNTSLEYYMVTRQE